MRELVQVKRRVDLGEHHALQLLGGERLDQPVLQHSGCVNHHPQWMLGRDRVDQRGQLVSIAHVACGNPRLAAKLSQLGEQLLCPRCPGAAAARQQQVPCAPLTGEVARHERPQAAGGARHEHSAVRVERGRGVRRGGDRLQSRRIRLPTPQRQLRLFGREQRGPRDPELRLRAVLREGVEVDERHAPGVLGLGAARQTPNRRRGEIGSLPIHERHRAPGQEHKLRFREPRLRQPRLQQLERLARTGARHPRQPAVCIVRRGNGGVHKHMVGDRPALLDRPRKRGQVLVSIALDVRRRRLAERGDAQLLVGAGDGQRLDPHGAEQRAPILALRARQLTCLHPAIRQRADRQHRLAGLIPHCHACRAPIGARQPHPQRRGAPARGAHAAQ